MDCRFRSNFPTGDFRKGWCISELATVLNAYVSCMNTPPSINVVDDDRKPGGELGGQARGLVSSYIFLILFYTNHNPLLTF